MSPEYFYLGFGFAVCFLLMASSMLFSAKTNSPQGGDSFECGVDSMMINKPLFFLHFFYILLLFLIFDVEIGISIPMVFSSLTSQMWNWFWWSFLTVLLVGLVVEYKWGTLDWKE